MWHCLICLPSPVLTRTGNVLTLFVFIHTDEVHGQQYMERVALDKRSCQHGVIYARFRWKTHTWAVKPVLWTGGKLIKLHANWPPVSFMENDDTWHAILSAENKGSNIAFMNSQILEVLRHQCCEKCHLPNVLICSNVLPTDRQKEERVIE